MAHVEKKREPIAVRVGVSNNLASPHAGTILKYRTVGLAPAYEGQGSLAVLGLKRALTIWRMPQITRSAIV